MGLNMVSLMFEDKSRMVTISTGWKFFAFNARDIMRLVMSFVVNNLIDAGNGNNLSRFEFLSDVSHRRSPMRSVFQT